MASTVSDLRNFRMKKTNGKVANGRKRIRVMSDSSDDEQSITKQTKTDDETIRQKENGLQTLRQITNEKIDYMVLQDTLARCDWNAQTAYNELEKDPKYRALLATSPIKTNAPAAAGAAALPSPTLSKPAHSPDKVRQSKKVRFSLSS